MEPESSYQFVDIIDIKVAEESKCWDEMVNRIEVYLQQQKEKKVELRDVLISKKEVVERQKTDLEI